jgi:long-chain fatty acid transport protein
MTSGSASIQTAGRSRTESDMQHFASATLGEVGVCYDRLQQSTTSARLSMTFATTAVALFRWCRCSRALFALVLALLLQGPMIATSAHAGGLYTNEFSTTSQANAGTGRGAWAPDASVTLHNPAAMTRMEDHAFASGFSLAVAQVHFDAESSSPSGSGNGGNQSGVAPIASFSYAHKASDRVRLGLSFFSISGSILDPSDNWAGRFELTELSLLTISITPTMAIRVTDWLSVGGGPIATYGVLNWDLKAEFPPASGTETNVRMNDLDDWVAAGRIGLLLHPNEDFALSVYYNSKTDFKLRGEVNGPVGLTPDLDLDLPLAQFVEVSAYWQATDRIALLATFNWEDWSEADDLSVTLGGVSTNAATGFMDTYKFGVGANYQLTPSTMLQTGLMYDTSALKNKDRTTALPIDDQIRFAFGFQHELTDSTRLGLSFVYLNLGQGEVRRATVVGDYQRNHAFVFGMTLAFNKLPWNGKLTYANQGS